MKLLIVWLTFFVFFFTVQQLHTYRAKLFQTLDLCGDLWNRFSIVKSIYVLCIYMCTINMFLGIKCKVKIWRKYVTVENQQNQSKKNVGEKVFKVFFYLNYIIYVCLSHSGTENLKQSRQKNSWNQVNHFFPMKLHF